ncbi:unnamed protein product [Owenia fusiformis]|uniref:VWFA domain-containing protein n=1 Tax=Owenia fusiformis TaxID=6347 RepID=A0A8S4PKZ0_OWEFU|nr:unnamed protein product [Owenia fusiformis]
MMKSNSLVSGELCGDVVFVLQTSCNLDALIIDNAQAFMTSIAMELSDHQKSTMSLITYSDNAAEVITPRSPAKFQKTLSNDGIKREGDCPNDMKAMTANALQLVSQTSDKTVVDKLVVVLNDGISFDRKSNMDATLEQTKQEINKLKANGAKFATFNFYEDIKENNDDKNLQLEYELYDPILEMNFGADYRDQFVKKLFGMDGFLCAMSDEPPANLPPCVVPSLDLMYVIDRSVSISPENIEKVKQFLIDLSKRIKEESPDTSIGAISYNRHSFTELNFTKDLATIEKALRDISNTTRKGTYTDEALEKARLVLEGLVDNGNQQHHTKLIILITDGVTNHYPFLSKTDTSAAAQTRDTKFTINKAKLLAPDIDLMILGLPNIRSLKKNDTMAEAKFNASRGEWNGAIEARYGDENRLVTNLFTLEKMEGMADRFEGILDSMCRSSNTV